MSKADPIRDLELLVRSSYGLIVIDTAEDERAEGLIRQLADRVSLPFFLWSRTKGLRRDGSNNAVYATGDPAQALGHIGSAQLNALYYMSGAEPLMADASLVERMRDVVSEFSKRSGAVVLAGPNLALPEPLRRLSASVSVPPLRLRISGISSLDCKRSCVTGSTSR
jgi:hypothetical protein